MLITSTLVALLFSIILVGLANRLMQKAVRLQTEERHFNPRLTLLIIILIIIAGTAIGTIIWGAWYEINNPAQFQQSSAKVSQEVPAPPPSPEFLPAPKVEVASELSNGNIGAFFRYLRVDGYLVLQMSDITGSVCYVPPDIAAELERNFKVQAETAEALKPQR